MSEYVERLVRGLDNRPKDWEYTGKCNDLGFPSGTCVCGHPIRFEFYIKDKVTGKEGILGSTCIEQYALFNPLEAERMRNDLEIIMERIRVSKKAAMEQKLIDDNAELINKYVEPLSTSSCDAEKVSKTLCGSGTSWSKN